MAGKWHRIVGALALALTCACSKSQPNIVVIVLDTARPDYLSAYGHPRPTSPYLEKFAKEGTRYDRAYSVSNWTLPSHASMFCGRRPQVHGATQVTRKIADSMPMMAEKLVVEGYQTAGFSNNPWVARHTGLARGFEHFVENEDTRTPFAATDGVEHKTVAAMRDWFQKTRQKDKPFFAFVNLIEPHMPYIPPWEFAEPFLPSREAYDEALARLFSDPRPVALVNRHYSTTDALSAEEWNQLRALYEGELLLVDDITRQLMEMVDANSDPKETLVFIVSDHGENIGDHDHLTHIFNLYDSNLRIVCLARGPGFAPGAVEQRLVQITDVYPTVMEAAGAPVESSCDGIDLRGELPADRQLCAWQDLPVMTMDTFSPEAKANGQLDRYLRELYAAIGPRYKSIEGSDDSRELFDLRADPNELRALDAEHVGDAVRKALNAGACKAKIAVKSTQSEPLDPATIERLKELGYIGEEDGD